MDIFTGTRFRSYSSMSNRRGPKGVLDSSGK